MSVENQQLQEIRNKLKEMRNQQELDRDVYIPITKVSNKLQETSFDIQPPKVYNVNDAAKLQKPLAHYIPIQLRKKLNNKTDTDPVFSYQDLLEIFENSRQQLAHEVNDYFQEMVDAQVRQYQQQQDVKRKLDKKKADFIM